jgi:hypothetical protein
MCLGAAVLAPMLNFITLQIPNAAVLLFPGWFQSGKQAAQGVEATGQRLIFLFGQLLVFIMVVIPAAIVFGVVLWVTRMTPIAIPLAAVAGAVVLAGEAALGLLLLGYLFERFDVSAETPGAV